MQGIFMLRIEFEITTHAFFPKCKFRVPLNLLELCML
jgi:hypothetical protein